MIKKDIILKKGEFAPCFRLMDQVQFVMYSKTLEIIKAWWRFSKDDVGFSKFGFLVSWTNILDARSWISYTSWHFDSVEIFLFWVVGTCSYMVCCCLRHFFYLVIWGSQIISDLPIFYCPFQPLQVHIQDH